MLFLLTDFPQKLKLEKIHDTFNNSLLCNPGVSSATKTFFSIKNTHKKQLQLQWTSSIQKLMLQTKISLTVPMLLIELLNI